MTEPPEPSEDDKNETNWDELERNAARDFVADSTPDMQEAIDAARAEYGDEQFDEMVAEVLRRANDPTRGPVDPFTPTDDDDALLDVLGAGDDVEGDAAAELLAAWRDDVDSVPPSPGTAPENIQQIHDFTQEIDRATAPPRTQEGNTEPMTIQEDAAQVRQIQTSQSAMGGISSASFSFAEGTQLNIPGEGGAQALAHAAEAVRGDMAAAVGLLGTGENAQRVQGAGENAAATVEAAQAAMAAAVDLSAQAAAAIETARAQIEAARESVGIFYNTVGDAASQHGA